MCVCVCVCGCLSLSLSLTHLISVLDVLRRFQQYFSNITTVAACFMKRDIALRLKVLPILMHHAADTRHRCTTQSHYPDPGTASPEVILRMLSV